MKRESIERLVYECMIPRPKASDPCNFNGILTRFLVFEVRQEVQSFYGHLDTEEARYPGLDYSHPVHRIRLSRWPWHRRLFRAFDTLRLTPAEIASLTKWEGTKWAKERYEKEQGFTIHDTAADDMPDYRVPGSSLANNKLEDRNPPSPARSNKTETRDQDPPLRINRMRDRNPDDPSFDADMRPWFNERRVADADNTSSPSQLSDEDSDVPASTSPSGHSVYSGLRLPS